MDWSLRSCGRHGHVTYAPNEPDLRARLHAQTPLGVAWRCLRCGDFVLGEPKGSGPAEDAPTVLRGKMLRDLVILRLLAVERLIRGLAVLLLAYAVFRFRDHRGSVITAFKEDLPLLEELANKFGWDLADSSLVHTVNSFLSFSPSTLTWLAAGLAAYAGLQFVEATGLWLLKRWGEYFAVVATSVFIPLEVYELVEKVTWVRIGALIINIAAVIYLLVTKRLFGLRGGHEAYMAERHEANLLEVEVAAETSGTGAPEHAHKTARAVNATATSGAAGAAATATVDGPAPAIAAEGAAARAAATEEDEPNIEGLRAAQDRTAKFTGAGGVNGDGPAVSGDQSGTDGGAASPADAPGGSRATGTNGSVGGVKGDAPGAPQSAGDTSADTASGNQSASENQSAVGPTSPAS